ncbi:YHS domain-containing protein [Thermodesulfobacteriota bacterium]
MSPFRLIILLILFYILYRLIVRGKKNVEQEKTRPEKLPVQDVLVQDPVCHTYIPKKQALHFVQGNETYHFCSEDCRKAFLTEKGETS